MSDFTPSTEQVKDAYVRTSRDAFIASTEEHKEEFDRWFDPIKNLIRDLTDPGECWFDHGGDCQEHGFFFTEEGQKCAHQEAKEWLRANGVGL